MPSKPAGQAVFPSADDLLAPLCYAPADRVWSKQGRVEYPVLEVDQVADGWAVYLIVKRGKRRNAETVDKAKAREMLQRQHDIGNGGAAG